MVSGPPAANVRLRLSSYDAPASTATPATGAAHEAAPEPAAAPAPRYVPNVPTLNPLVDDYDMRAFGKGLLGAALGALVGGVAIYLLFAHTGVRLKLLALGVGFLAGMGARLLGKDRSKQLGMLGAMLSIGMIVGAQYLVVWKWFHEEDSAEKADPSKSEYELRVEEARNVVAAIPNGTDQEIRLYLAKEQAEEGEKPDPKSVDPDDIQEFKTEDLPQYRKLADGAITKEQFEKELSEQAAVSAEERQKEKEEGERVFKWVFLAFAMSKFNIVCMVGAAGIAYKMIADA